MTLGGLGIFILVSLLIISICCLFGLLMDTRTSIRTSLIVGIVLSAFVFVGMLWYFNNTADGARQLKSQQSNFNGGIERTVTVYDVNGQQIQKYEGKFDVDYDDNRIIFDDENGKRHVIYYPTGTVIIDEK